MCIYIIIKHFIEVTQRDIRYKIDNQIQSLNLTKTRDYM